MVKRIIKTVVVVSSLAMLIFTESNRQPKIINPIITERVTVKPQEYIGAPIGRIEVKTLTKSTVFGMSDKDIDLMALVTMAEAEGETERGKRLVISTILNRVDSEQFPDTIEDVVYQSGAFSSIWNGRIDRCYVREDIRQLVIDELKTRTNNDVIFFGAGDYSEFGKPMFSEGDHYFSSYN